MIVDKSCSCLCMSYANSTLWICVMHWNQDGKMCVIISRRCSSELLAFLGVISFPVLLTLHECAPCFFWMQQPTDDPAEALESWFPWCCLNRYSVVHKGTHFCFSSSIAGFSNNACSGTSCSLISFPCSCPIKMPLICGSNWHLGTGTEARLQNHYKGGQTKRYVCKYQLFVQVSDHFTTVSEYVSTQSCQTSFCPLD